MRIRHERLTAKGWTPKELAKVHGAIRRAERRKHWSLGLLELGVFWVLLFLAVAGVVVVCVALIPLLILLPPLVNGLILACLGACLGFLFTMGARDIEWLEHHHHLFTLVFLVFVSLFAVWYTVRTTAALESSLGFTVPQPGFLLGLVFALAFVAPYALHLWRRR